MVQGVADACGRARSLGCRHGNLRLQDGGHVAHRRYVVGEDHRHEDDEDHVLLDEDLLVGERAREARHHVNEEPELVRVLMP